jgi:alpha-glucosidase
MQPVLVEGGIRFLPTPEPVLAFVREHAGERLLVAFNLSAAAVDCALDVACGDAVDAPGVEQGAYNHGRLLLPAHGAFYARLP